MHASRNRLRVSVDKTVLEASRHKNGGLLNTDTSSQAYPTFARALGALEAMIQTHCWKMQCTLSTNLEVMPRPWRLRHLAETVLLSAFTPTPNYHMREFADVTPKVWEETSRPPTLESALAQVGSALSTQGQVGALAYWVTPATGSIPLPQAYRQLVAKARAAHLPGVGVYLTLPVAKALVAPPSRTWAYACVTVAHELVHASSGYIGNAFPLELAEGAAVLLSLRALDGTHPMLRADTLILDPYIDGLYTTYAEGLARIALARYGATPTAWSFIDRFHRDPVLTSKLLRQELALQFGIDVPLNNPASLGALIVGTSYLATGGKLHQRDALSHLCALIDFSAHSNVGGLPYGSGRLALLLSPRKVPSSFPN